MLSAPLYLPAINFVLFINAHALLLEKIMFLVGFAKSAYHQVSIHFGADIETDPAARLTVSDTFRDQRHEKLAVEFFIRLEWRHALVEL